VNLTIRSRLERSTNEIAVVAAASDTAIQLDSFAAAKSLTTIAIDFDFHAFSSKLSIRIPFAMS
jgi:hypothetical protein